MLNSYTLFNNQNLKRRMSDWVTDLTHRNVKIVIEFALTYLWDLSLLQLSYEMHVMNQNLASEFKICCHHINNLQRHSTQRWKWDHHREFEADLDKPSHTTMLVLSSLRISIGKSFINSQVEVQCQNRLLITVKTAVKSLFSSRRWSSKYI